MVNVDLLASGCQDLLLLLSLSLFLSSSLLVSPLEMAAATAHAGQRRLLLGILISLLLGISLLPLAPLLLTSGLAFLVLLGTDSLLLSSLCPTLLNSLLESDELLLLLLPALKVSIDQALQLLQVLSHALLCDVIKVDGVTLWKFGRFELGLLLFNGLGLRFGLWYYHWFWLWLRLRFWLRLSLRLWLWLWGRLRGHLNFLYYFLLHGPNIVSCFRHDDRLDLFLGKG